MTRGPRLRLAFVYDARYPEHQGGAERRIHELAIRLAARHEVHLVSWGSPMDAPRPELTNLVLDPVGRMPALYGADGRRTIREAAAFAVRLLPVLLRLRVDVIDCAATPYLPAYTCWAAARMTRTPMIVTWHEFWGAYWTSYLHDRPMAARVARALEAGCRPLGDGAVAVSAFSADRVADEGRHRRPEVVPNGVSLEEIDGAAPGPASDVLFVGRLIEDKHVDDLLRAVAGLTIGGRSPTLAVVGDGPERGRLEYLANQLGLAETTTFCGILPTTEVFARMRAASILVLPSTREGYGMTVVEAQAAGAVPVVARSPMSAASALVRDGVDGLVCNPEPASIRDAIRRLLRDAEGHATMRRAARATAEGRSWDAAADAIESLYLAVAAGAVTRSAQRDASWT